MARLTIICMVLLTAAFSGTQNLFAQENTARSERVDRARSRGKEITMRAFGTLSSNLMQAVSRGGVSNALEFCSLNAASLTKSAANTNLIEVRRVSHKARNPGNKANAAELAVLKQFRSGLASGKAPTPVIQTGADGSATYFAPIALNNPLCLNCHGQPGSEIKKENLAVIKRLYPKDEATGFKLGELRGMWRIDFKPSALADEDDSN